MVRLPDFRQTTPQTLVQELQQLSRYLNSAIGGSGKDGARGDDGQDGKNGEDGLSGVYELTQEYTSTSGSTVTLDADPTGQVRVIFTNTISAATQIVLPAPTKEGWFDLFVQVPAPVGAYPGALHLDSPSSGTHIKTYSIGGLSSPAGYIDRLVAVYFNGAFIWKVHSSNNWNA